MNQTPHGMTAIVIGAIVLFSLYRRFRSHIGRQPVRPRAMMFRIGFLALIAVGMQLVPHLAPYARIEELAGIAAGAALAWWGLRMTRFSADGTQRYYTPNVWLGLAVSSLLIARIAYRFIVLAPVVVADGSAGGVPPPMPFTGPAGGVTLALFGVVAGYYVAYYTGVLRRSRNLAPAVAEPAAVSGTP